MVSRGSRVLVTGGVGFIGSHHCERLLKAGHTITWIDHLSTGCKARTTHVKDSSRFPFIFHDVTLPLAGDVTEIFDLACPASPACYQADPIHTLKTRVLGSLNALEVATQQCAKVLQASKSEVYGNPESHPQKETYLGCVNPVSCSHVTTKGRAAEAPVMAGKHVAFCYIDDLTEALVRLMRSPDACLGPINLGYPAEFTILELAEMILELTGSRSRLVLHPLPSDDPARRRPDLTRAEGELNWRSQIPLKDGLLRTIEYFDDFLRAQPRPMIEPRFPASDDPRSGWPRAV